MTRLVCLLSAVLLVLFCTHASHASPQLAPEVKKISILDLFQEEPNLKAELEARLVEKMSKQSDDAPQAKQDPAHKPMPKATTTTTTTTAATTTAAATTATTAATHEAENPASQDKQVARPLRLRAAGGSDRRVAVDQPPAPAAASADAVEGGAAEAESDGEGESSPVRKLRPHRLTLNRSRPGVAAALTTTTESLPEIKLEDDLVKQLSEGSDGDAAADDTSATSILNKPRAKFSLPPRRGSRTESAVGDKKVSEVAHAGTTNDAGAKHDRANSGVGRLRNARFGNTRLHNDAAATTTDSASASTKDAQAKPTTRLSLAERRARFSNARSPQSDAGDDAAAAADEAAAVADEAAAAAPATADDKRKNGRRFPTLTRRNSSSP